MTITSLTRKEALWLACRQKTCCYTAVVIPTGRDVWRIAHALETPPWSFLVYFQTAQPRRDAFALDHSGRRFRMALAKAPARRGKKPPPCIFLLRTRTDHHRCGLGDLRPGVCLSFPSELVNGLICVRPDTGCECRDWSLADVDLQEEAAVLAERQSDVETYCGVVEHWNALVDSAPLDAEPTFTDFCAFLLAAYDSIAADNGRDTDPDGNTDPDERDGRAGGAGQDEQDGQRGDASPGEHAAGDVRHGSGPAGEPR